MRLGRARLVKLGLLGLVLALALAAAYTSSLIVQQQQTLREVSRYNPTWLVSQAALEVSRLEGMAMAALVPDSGVDEDDVRRRTEEMATLARRRGEMIDRITARRAAE